VEIGLNGDTGVVEVLMVERVGVWMVKVVVVR